MKRLGAALYTGPTGTLLIDLARARGVTFSTNERGFAEFSCFVPLSLVESFYHYDRAGLPHLAVTWAGGVVWEGRLEDVAIVPGGLRLTALGYIRGYADAPYSASHIGVTAATTVQALIAAVSGLNSFMSSSTMLVQDPGVTFSDIYEDIYPIAILERLCNLGDSQTTPRLWEAGVWEKRILHFRPRGDAARQWYIDVAAPEIERTLETLYNSAYSAYQDGGNARAVTATSTDSTSVARYGLTRRAVIGLQAIDGTLAGKVRDAYLADHKDPPPRADIGFKRLYDQFGTLWPAYVARSGDTLTLRNLPPTASASIDRIRTFRLKETRYDADEDYMTVIPESLRPGLAPQENATRLTSVADPNNMYQPRPTLAELYAPFGGLLGLRGLWYPGSVDSTGALYDQSGQGRTLTYNGNPTLNLHNSFIPYWDYDGTGDYHSRADESGLDVLGTEANIASGYKGLTVGGWFWIDSFGGGDRGLVSKYTATGNQRSYLLYTNNGTPDARAIVSVDGTAATQVNHGTVLTTGAWHFIWMRFRPSTSLTISVDGVNVQSSTSIPAAIFGSTAGFNLGAFNAGTSNQTGRNAITFLCASALLDAQLSHLFERTRRFFGV